MRYLRDEGPYPAACRLLPDPPRVLLATGSLERTRPAVAIVGSRNPCASALAFARTLASALAARGVVVVSGGAVGVDAAAHRGALDAGGATWAVLPTDRHKPFPKPNVRLFQAVALSPGGRLVWPTGTASPHAMTYRNGVLCALSDVVVVVQAHIKSGSLNAANWARQLGRPLWMVPASPWDRRYGGALSLLATGRATPLWSLEAFLETFDRAEGWAPPERVSAALGPPAPGKKGARSRARRKRPQSEPLPGLRSPDEMSIISALSRVPTHVEEIVRSSGVPASTALTALLTLALEDVVVEGPDGFFCLKNAE